MKREAQASMDLTGVLAALEEIRDAVSGNDAADALLDVVLASIEDHAEAFEADKRKPISEGTPESFDTRKQGTNTLPSAQENGNGTSIESELEETKKQGTHSLPSSDNGTGNGTSIESESEEQKHEGTHTLPKAGASEEEVADAGKVTTKDPDGDGDDDSANPADETKEMKKDSKASDEVADLKVQLASATNRATKAESALAEIQKQIVAHKRYAQLAKAGIEFSTDRKTKVIAKLMNMSEADFGEYVDELTELTTTKKKGTTTSMTTEDKPATASLNLERKPFQKSNVRAELEEILGKVEVTPRNSL